MYLHLWATPSLLGTVKTSFEAYVTIRFPRSFVTASNHVSIKIRLWQLFNVGLALAGRDYK